MKETFEAVKKWLAEFFGFAPRSVNAITSSFVKVVAELDDASEQLHERAIAREQNAQKLLEGAVNDRLESAKADRIADSIEELFGLDKRAQLPALPTSKPSAAADA